MPNIYPAAIFYWQGQAAPLLLGQVGFGVDFLADSVGEDELFLLSDLALLGPLYPSEYQPLPFNWKELTEMSFFRDPLHDGQVVFGASEIL